jgi:hypothetical protein
MRLRSGHLLADPCFILDHEAPLADSRDSAPADNRYATRCFTIAFRYRWTAMA